MNVFQMTRGYEIVPHAFMRSAVTWNVWFVRNGQQCTMMRACATHDEAVEYIKGIAGKPMVFDERGLALGAQGVSHG